LYFLSQSLLTVTYFLNFPVFEDPKIQKLEIFNETMLLFCACICYGFTEYAYDAMGRYQIGWLLAGCMLFTVGVNTLIATIDQV
jgi:hypothetical protein